MATPPPPFASVLVPMATLDILPAIAPAPAAKLESPDAVAFAPHGNRLGTSRRPVENDPTAMELSAERD